MSPKNIRNSLHPCLMLSFIIMGLTGVLMMFHMGFPGIKQLHEWLGVVFLIICVIHLHLNWKVFRAHFKNGPVLLSVIGIGLLSALLLISGGGKNKNGAYGHAGAGHYGHSSDRHYK